MLYSQTQVEDQMFDAAKLFMKQAIFENLTVEWIGCETPITNQSKVMGWAEV